MTAPNRRTNSICVQNRKKINPASGTLKRQIGRQTNWRQADRYTSSYITIILGRELKSTGKEIILCWPPRCLKMRCVPRKGVECDDLPQPTSEIPREMGS